MSSQRNLLILGIDKFCARAEKELPNNSHKNLFFILYIKGEVCSEFTEGGIGRIQNCKEDLVAPYFFKKYRKKSTVI